ncbi:condensation domain-containing protein [Streptomyces sp. JV184]|uniref:condensation domain-containing protein n=1 Tax=Streptomyces sp. JV184 TaxID=858637 RepID=UPI002E77FA65|nr:condensation domain-containing protein [Streptomyces sp. JV184]MEE1750524.1 condensation domain-containing protein [Streptomyces sp. JV184]
MTETGKTSVVRRRAGGAERRRRDEAELTTAVARIWRDLLGAEATDDDDFFELGGDSLLATWAAARIQDELGIDVTLDDLFQQTRLGALVAHLRLLPRRPRSAEAAVAADGGALTAAERAVWLAAELAPQATAYLISVVVRVRGDLAADLLEAALGDVITRHEALRTAFPLVGTEPERRVEASVRVPVTRVTEAGPPGPERLRELAAEDAEQPIELGRAPLFRARLVADGDRAAALLLTVHHAVFDARSLELLVRELGECCAARADGRAADLTPVPGPGVFGARQHAWLAGPEGRRAVAELAGSLSGLPAPGPFPRTEPSGTVEGAAEGVGAQRREQVDGHLARAVRRLALRHGATLHMVGLAAFAVALADLTGTDDLAVGAAFSGRTTPEAQDAIGCFVNVLPIRVRTSGPEPFADVLARVRDATLFVARHQDVPFDQVRAWFRQEGAAPPEVRVAFGAQDVARPAYRGEGFELTGREADTEQARLDLTCWLEAAGEDSLQAFWTYRPGLLTSSDVAALHRRFVDVLRAGTGTEPADS